MTSPASPIERLLAEQACIELAHRYAELADSHDPDAFEELFEADGEWGRADGSSIRGGPQIRAAYAGRARVHGSRHVVLGAFARMSDEGRAKVRSTVLVLRPSDGRVAAFLTANLDEVRRQADGGWRIQRRSSEILLHGPIDAGAA
jgi:uncharacterized protein (TIGR02246 family)